MKLRKPLRLFAQRMETILRRNDHKGGWNVVPYSGYLFDRLVEETYELYAALKKATHTMQHEVTDEECLQVVKECCDVANFAMMIADRSGGLDIEDLPSKLFEMAGPPTGCKPKSIHSSSTEVWIKEPHP